MKKTILLLVLAIAFTVSSCKKDDYEDSLVHVTIINELTYNGAPEAIIGFSFYTTDGTNTSVAYSGSGVAANSSDTFDVHFSQYGNVICYIKNQNWSYTTTPTKTVNVQEGGSISLKFTDAL